MTLDSDWEDVPTATDDDWEDVPDGRKLSQMPEIRLNKAKEPELMDLATEPLRFANEALGFTANAAKKSAYGLAGAAAGLGKYAMTGDADAGIRTAANVINSKTPIVRAVDYPDATPSIGMGLISGIAQSTQHKAEKGLGVPEGSMTPAVEFVMDSLALTGGIKATPKIADAVKTGVDRVTGNYWTPEKLDTFISESIDKGIEPTYKNRNSAGAVSSFRKDAVNAVKTLTDMGQKGVLEFKNPETGMMEARLPRTRAEFSEAIRQGKSKLYEQYSKLAQQAGDKGVLIGTESIVNEFTTMLNDKARQLMRPTIETLIKDKIERLQGQQYTPETASQIIKLANESWDNYIKNPSPEAYNSAAIEMVIANHLRAAMDAKIEGAVGPGWQKLRTAYKELSALEKDATKAALRDARRIPVSLLDFTDMFSASEVATGLATGNAALAVKGGTMFAVKQYLKALKDRNRYIDGMFKRTGKEYKAPMEPLPETPVTPPAPLALPAPEPQAAPPRATDFQVTPEGQAFKNPYGPQTPVLPPERGLPAPGQTPIPVTPEGVALTPPKEGVLPQFEQMPPNAVPPGGEPNLMPRQPAPAPGPMRPEPQPGVKMLPEQAPPITVSPEGTAAAPWTVTESTRGTPMTEAQIAQSQFKLANQGNLPKTRKELVSFLKDRGMTREQILKALPKIAAVGGIATVMALSDEEQRGLLGGVALAGTLGVGGYKAHRFFDHGTIGDYAQAIGRISWEGQQMGKPPQLIRQEINTAIAEAMKKNPQIGPWIEKLSIEYQKQGLKGDAVIDAIGKEFGEWQAANKGTVGGSAVKTLNTIAESTEQVKGGAEKLIQTKGVQIGSGGTGEYKAHALFDNAVLGDNMRYIGRRASKLKEQGATYEEITKAINNDIAAAAKDNPQLIPELNEVAKELVRQGKKPTEALMNEYVEWAEQNKGSAGFAEVTQLNDITNIVGMLKDQIKKEGGGKKGTAIVAAKYGIPAAAFTAWMLMDDEQKKKALNTAPFVGMAGILGFKVDTKKGSAIFENARDALKTSKDSSGSISKVNYDKSTLTHEVLREYGTKEKRIQNAAKRRDIDPEFGAGFWYRPSTNRLNRIGRDSLGPHGDHDGWISIGDNAKRLGFNVKEQRRLTAFQNAMYGIDTNKYPNFKKFEDGFDGYVDSNSFGSNPEFVSEFKRTFGMHPYEAQQTYTDFDLVRVRVWPKRGQNNAVGISVDVTNPENFSLKKIQERLLPFIEQKGKTISEITVDYDGKYTKVSLNEFLEAKKITDLLRGGE